MIVDAEFEACFCCAGCVLRPIFVSASKHLRRFAPATVSLGDLKAQQRRIDAPSKIDAAEGPQSASQLDGDPGVPHANRFLVLTPIEAELEKVWLLPTSEPRNLELRGFNHMPPWPSRHWLSGSARQMAMSVLAEQATVCATKAPMLRLASVVRAKSSTNYLTCQVKCKAATADEADWLAGRLLVARSGWSSFNCQPKMCHFQAKALAKLCVKSWKRPAANTALLSQAADAQVKVPFPPAVEFQKETTLPAQRRKSCGIGSVTRASNWTYLPDLRRQLASC